MRGDAMRPRGSMEEKIGEKFQRETKYERRHMPRGSLDLNSKPPMYKDYPGAPRIALPPVDRCGDMSLHEALLRRKSQRSFLDTPISLDMLSCVLWSSSGIQRKEMGFDFRTAPSAGALYPVETYTAVNHVAGVEQGTYHYSVKHHALEELNRGDYSQAVVQAALGQGMCASAAAVIFFTAVFERSVWKYRQRAYRYIYLDAGHMAQNLALTSTSLGLGCCHIGSMFDNEVNGILGIDGTRESVVYMSVIGHPGMYV
jgi:SagB-type dehydrogenase family enzyme